MVPQPEEIAAFEQGWPLQDGVTRFVQGTGAGNEPLAQSPGAGGDGGLTGLLPGIQKAVNGGIRVDVVDVILGQVGLENLRGETSAEIGAEEKALIIQ